MHDDSDDGDMKVDVDVSSDDNISTMMHGV